MELLTDIYHWSCLPIALIYLVFIQLPHEAKINIVIRNPMIDGLIFFLSLWVIIGFFTNLWWLFLILAIIALSPNFSTEENKHKKLERYRAVGIFITITIIFITHLKF